MQELWLILGFIAAVGFAAGGGLSLMTGSVFVAAVLLGFAVFGDASIILQAVLWVIFLGIAVPLNHKPFRKQYLTRPLLKQFRAVAPKISDTEATALKAGTVGWEGELFGGRPRFKRLLAQKKPELSADERAFISGPVEEVCKMVDIWEVTHERADLPPEVWQYLKDNKFFGMIIPKKYGGLEFSAYAHGQVLEKLASRSVTLSSTVAVPNSLGPAELLLHYGTDEQKNYYLPRLANGEEIPCFALTGPTAGSDATSIPDEGIVCEREYEGKKELGVALTFDKRYITLAPVATVVGLAFRLYDPDHLLSDEEDRGISLALLPRDTKGLDVGRRHLPLNIPFQNGPVRGEDVFIPLRRLIGGESMIGEGWRMLVECLSVGRAISLPSSSTGGMKAATFATGAYARIRKQFNMPIGRFEGIEEALARMAGETYASSALSAMTAHVVDQGEKPAVPSAISKYHTTEACRRVVTDAMDVHGGKAVILGPKNYLGRGWQGAPISITVEGANIMTRSLMIFGQGAIRCHPWVLRQLKALEIEDRDEALDAFDHTLWGHVGHAFGNYFRSFWFGLTGGSLSSVPGDRSTRRHYRRVLRYSSALAICADVAMLVLGGKLKFKERLSARLGDVLSQLYIASAMLKRFDDQGSPSADKPVLNYAMEDCFYKIQEALSEFLRNFPVRPVAWKLSALVFPLGRRQKRPTDRLGHKTASLLLSPNETRDRLVQGIFRTACDVNLIGQMNETLSRVIQTEPMERKIMKALKAGEITERHPEAQLKAALDLGLITEDEFKLMEQTRAEVAEIIAVDDFDPEELQAAMGAHVEKSSTKAA